MDSLVLQNKQTNDEQENDKQIKRKRLNKVRIPVWLTAFLVNLLVAMLAICPFLIRNNGYLAMSHDFSAQEIPFHILMDDTVRSGNLLWSWAIDLGGNFIESFSFYNLGSIFVWLEWFFMPSAIPIVMAWMMIFKFAVAGAASAGWLGRQLKNRTVIIFASVLYAFSGFQCTSVVFYHFQDVVALFPFLLIGLEQLVEEKKSGRLLFACFINVMCNYVFFVGEILFLILYYIIRYMLPQIKRKTQVRNILKPIGMCIREGLFGMLLSGALLIPSIAGTLSNSRVNEHLAAGEWLSMSTFDWLMLIKAFFFPAETMTYYSGTIDATWMTNAAYLPLTGCMLAIAYVLTRRDWLSTLLKVCGVIAVVPLFNSVFMFFSNESYRRWYYMLILFMALATAKVIEYPRRYRIRTAAVICSLIIALYAVMTNVFEWNKYQESIINYSDIYWIGFGIAAGGVLLSLITIYVFGRFRKRIFLVLSILLSAFLLLYNIRNYQLATDNTNLDMKNYRNYYGENVVNYLTEFSRLMDRNTLPYRYYIDEGIGHSYYNLAMTNSLPAINSFISTVHSSVTELYDELGVGRIVWSEAEQAGLKELLGARYILTPYETEEYSFVQAMGNSNGQVMYLYQNEKALPIGFTYDSYITRSEFRQYDKELRALVMLNTLVVEDEDEETVKDILLHFAEYGYPDSEDGKPAYEGQEPKMIPADISAEALDEYLESHDAESCESFENGENYFTANISSSAEKYAFFSVPYDKWWHAQVNGKDVEILNINGLMAVRVDKGDNTIVFTYEYLPLRVGIICSIMGIILTAGYIVRGIIDRRYRTENRVLQI